MMNMSLIILIIANKHKNHEYLILAFDGEKHLYCLNSDCKQADAYKPYLTECRPRVKPSLQPILAIDHHTKFDRMSRYSKNVDTIVTGRKYFTSSIVLHSVNSELFCF